MKNSNHQTLIVGSSKSHIKAIEQRLSRQTKVSVVTRLGDLKDAHIHSFQLILLLHALPEENGLSKLEKWKEFHPKLPAVLVGTDISQEVVLSAFRMGVKDICSIQEEQDFVLRLGNLIRQTPSNRAARNIKSWIHSIKIPNDFLGIVATPSPFTSECFNHQNTSDISIQLLGNFQLFIKGKTIDIKLPNKSKALLVYLLFHRHANRKKLLQTFWRGQLEDAAKNNLNVSICQIRKWFKTIDKEVNYIICKGDTYEINQNLILETDYDQFRAACTQARRAEQEQCKEKILNDYFKAYANYRGNFVEDISKEEWIESERNSLEERFLYVLDRLCQLFLEAERFPIALNIAEKILKIDLCMEYAHRYKMLAYWKMGKRKKAIEQFQYCKSILKEELNINLGQKTLGLYEEIVGGS